MGFVGVVARVSVQGSDLCTLGYRGWRRGAMTRRGSKGLRFRVQGFVGGDEVL